MVCPSSQCDDPVAINTNEVQAFAAKGSRLPNHCNVHLLDSSGTGPEQTNPQKKSMRATVDFSSMGSLESGIGQCVAAATRQKHNVGTSVPKNPTDAPLVSAQCCASASMSLYP